MRLAMKKKLMLALSALLLSFCNKPASNHHQVMGPAQVKVDKTRLYADVQYLTDISPPRHAFKLPSFNKSAAYIHSEFSKVAALKAIYPDKGNFISVVGNRDQGKLVRHMKQMMQAGSNIDVQYLTAPAAVPGVDFSNHLNYWKYKFPAVMITNTAFFRNPHYHLPSDRIETLNFDKMAEVVRGVYWAVVHLD